MNRQNKDDNDWYQFRSSTTHKGVAGIQSLKKGILKRQVNTVRARVEPSAQCENMIKTRPAVNIQICEKDYHDYYYEQADQKQTNSNTEILMMLNLSQTMIVSRAVFRIWDLLIQNN